MRSSRILCWCIVLHALILTRASPEERQNFLISITGRSGSTWLAALLNSHPDATSFPGNGVLTGKPCCQGQGRACQARSPECMKEKIKAFYDGVHKTSVVGFKAQPWAQLRDQFAELLPYMKEKRFKLICNYRNSLFRRAVSGWRHKKNEQICNGSAHGTLECFVPKTRIPPIEFRAYLDRSALSNGKNLQWCHDMAAHLPVLYVSYEELNANTDLAVGKIQDFLGLARHDLTSKFIKDTGSIISDKVTNLEELKKEYVDWLTTSPHASEPLSTIH